MQKNIDGEKLNHQLNICLWILVPIALALIVVLVILS